MGVFNERHTLTVLMPAISIHARYKHTTLHGASTWILASAGESFEFSEIVLKGNAHLAFMPTGAFTDSASVLAGNVVGDKTGTMVTNRHFAELDTCTLLLQCCSFI